MGKKEGMESEPKLEGFSLANRSQTIPLALSLSV